MKKMPKVLVACPIIDRNKYCFEKFITCYNSLTYQNKELLLVDNSATTDFYNELKSKKINVIRGKHFEKTIEALVYNRNVIRSYLLARDYEYLFSLDSDVICESDAIEKLMKHQKQIVSGIYYSARLENGKIAIKPMLFSRPGDEEFKKLATNENFQKLMQQNSLNKEDIFKQLNREEILEPKLITVDVAGLGIVLIKKEVLEKIPFRFDPKIKATDDFFFFIDTQKAGYKLYVDTTVKCAHLHGQREQNY